MKNMSDIDSNFKVGTQINRNDITFYNCRNEKFDVYKTHSVKCLSRDVPLIELREDEKDSVIIERDGKHYIVIRTDPENGPIAFMNHISYENLEDIIE